MGYISDVTVGGVNYPVGSSLYGTCDTAASTAAKVVTMANFDTLKTGVTIHVLFTYGNVYKGASLNVNSTGSKNIKYHNGTGSGLVETFNYHWEPGSVKSFTYDGTYWRLNDSTPNTTLICYTLSSVAQKEFIGSIYQYPLTGYFPIYFLYDNTYAGQLSLKQQMIGDTGSRIIYINGTISSSTNYTLPSGFYIGYAEQVNSTTTNYYFRTDGEITCPDDITANEIANDIFNSQLDPIDVDNITQTEINNLFD